MTAPAGGSGRLTYGRDRRIRKRSEFLRVQAEGKRATSQHFVLLVAAQVPTTSSRGPGAPGAAPSRLGVVVTKKVGNAVQRNRIKRLCREVFRHWPGYVPAGVDLVVIARGPAYTLAMHDVKREWERARPALLRHAALALEAAARAAAEPRSTP